MKWIPFGTTGKTTAVEIFLIFPLLSIKAVLKIDINGFPSRFFCMCKAFKIVLSAIIAIVLISFFVLLYSYAGIHLTNTTNSTDYKWRSHELKTTMTEGFSWLCMDKNGFNNESVPTKIDCLLLGSSHMEAVQMNHDENVSGRLNQLIPLSTYNIGISGHTIYRCIDNYKSAIEEFKPGKYSIIETSTVNLSLSEMKSVIDGSAKRIPSYDHGLMHYLQLIPAFRPIYNQIENWATIKNPGGRLSEN